MKNRGMEAEAPSPLSFLGYPMDSVFLRFRAQGEASGVVTLTDFEERRRLGVGLSPNDKEASRSNVCSYPIGIKKSVQNWTNMPDKVASRAEVPGIEIR